ncbi:orotidine 5'-phosphate decarboxylase / HUMPS family protein [Methanorbis rubei]|uniref:3-keto-L-gulonate-6-phosphate decarboxylase UlaD n=1 Tax=Methanorbis rubei TaxID=3028300 RepID=A0AAE4MGF6_9EURY|nr:3-keto-L-gulonate-6-phosphate decarboxylase UlaD [Methanocorpusculaceae archaeon Cs1]
MVRPVLQVALDLTELSRAEKIAEEAVAGGADWIEIGTPLIKSEGMESVRKLRSIFPHKTLVADLKTSDTGSLEVEMAAKAGANVVCVLAAADNAVISDALRGAALYGVEIMADMMNVKDPGARAEELAGLGVQIINAHVGIDQQMEGKDPLDLLDALGKLPVKIAVAGGLNAKTAAAAAARGADIVIVGGTIIKAAEVQAAAAEVRAALDNPNIEVAEKKSLDDQIRELLKTVSAPNVTDALYRKGAMIGLSERHVPHKMIGKAVTVQTFGGDWSKPVQAIDFCERGDILVINNDGKTDIAPWGELATRSAINRGVGGIVIDGAVRDWDDILTLDIPVFATAVQPNAGEPKGFGEINAEITCCGQTVRAGDWLIGDQSGVVVIPRERAYEVARRAVEVFKNEVRVREEIRRGGTLGSLAQLLRWEKK